MSQWRQTILVMFCRSGSAALIIPIFTNILTTLNPLRRIWNRRKDSESSSQ